MQPTNTLPMNSYEATRLNDFDFGGFVDDVIGTAQDILLTEGEKKARELITGDSGANAGASSGGAGTYYNPDPYTQNQLPSNTGSSSGTLPAPGNNQSAESGTKTFNVDSILSKAKQHKGWLSLGTGGLTMLLSKSWIAGLGVGVATYFLTDKM